MKFKTAVIVVLLSIGLWQVSTSGYMLAKAWLSHILIADAWSQTLKDKQFHKPWSWADTYPIAQLNIPKLNKNSYILEGSSGRNLAFSATHLPQSGMPDENKSMIVSGHNDTHFSYLQFLQIGDEIEVKTISDNHVYKIKQIEIVNSQISQLLIKDKKELILTTCYPFNSLTTGSKQRLVVYASKIDNILHI
ncbi:MAG TPA: class GN sortase [Gammaproteobacteria bacterium]|nr:class GN sortase [Xanthomonadales bacterium]MCB1593577.1 class GN sortase [Xanthomonadales bacterium]HOP22446.1 class GN sortase [Gammaproteobacteria bacterium]HPI94978.1 class GN sortase [Gammaproteobacteria bacterium]HPQ86244.1 class GN sortase [Gammaproteobacteria bacterium]